MKCSDLQTKDVVNVIDGRRLGFIRDIELDIRTGAIVAIIIPIEGKWLGWFGRDRDWIVPWAQVIKVGRDVILVKLPAAQSERIQEDGK